MKLLTPFFLILFSCFAYSNQQAIAQTTDLKPYRAVYVAGYKFLPFKGKAIRELKQLDANQWLLSDRVISPVVKIDERSEFSWKNGVLIPSSYRYKMGGLAKDRMESIDFNWDDSVAVSSYKKGSYDLPLAAGMLDKVSYQLKLRMDIINNGVPDSYHIAARKNVRQLDFEIVGEEQIKTKLGIFNALKIVRKRAPGNKRLTHVWLATDWDYLLLKLRQTEKGKTYEIVLSEAELDGVTLSGLQQD